MTGLKEKQTGIENPYYERYVEAVEHQNRHSPYGYSRVLGGMDQPGSFCWCPECKRDGEDRQPYGRWTNVRKYGFAVPDADAIAAIAALQKPVVEVGAGHGYWAMLLARAGVEVEAYDTMPPNIHDNANRYFEVGEVFHPVFQNSHAYAVPRANELDAALMLIWPEMEDWPAEALKMYRGDTVVYVGEGWGGCTADDEFHEILGEEYWYDETPLPTAEGWYIHRVVDIPQWGGVHDRLKIYRRAFWTPYDPPHKELTV